MTIRSKYDLFKIAGIPIRLHITTFLLIPLILSRINTGMGRAPSLLESGEALLITLLVIVLLLSSVAAHELGHSLVALHLKCAVDEILLTPIGGIAKLRGMPENHHGEIQIAVAGPMVSFLLAGIFALVHYGPLGGLLPGFGGALVGGAMVINLMLGGFNLLPAFPMDGGRILRACLVPRKGWVEATRIAAKGGKIVAGGFAIYGLLRGPGTLVFIGIFIYFAASMEYRMLLVQQRMNGMFGGDAAPPPSTGFEVGPAPYADQDDIKKHPSFHPGGKGSLLDDTWIAGRTLFSEIGRRLRKI